MTHNYNTNRILNSDSYKNSHHLQTVPGTEYVSSYIESRGGAYDFTLFYGLQMELDRLIAPTIAEVSEAEEFLTAHGFEFNKQWYDIADLGYLPLRIQAIKEGTVLPTKNVLVQVINTDPRFPWLTSFIETSLLRAVWFSTTVSTRSKFIKSIIADALEKSGTPNQLPFKLVDFGARGVSSEESAAIGGSAHLVNFMATDTISGVLYAKKFYDESMAGFSIPSSEHSTMTVWGRDNEVKAYSNMLDRFAKPGAMVGVVSDSWDIYNAVENIWGNELRQKVIDSGATIVIRPDSGDPTVVPVEVVKLLAGKFGTTRNEKGYDVLPPCIRVLQGDGINEKSIQIILDRLLAAGFSADNISFGMGGEMLQTVNRDHLKFAMKASAAYINGEWVDVFKDPVTDPGKKSKKGRLGIVLRDGVYQTVSEADAENDNLLEDVFLDGRILRRQTFSEIRYISNS